MVCKIIDDEIAVEERSDIGLVYAPTHCDSLWNSELISQER